MNLKLSEKIKKMLDDEDFCIDHDDLGYCTNCGDEVKGVEPDARKYKCENCGEKDVYGLEELIIMGYGV